MEKSELFEKLYALLEHMEDTESCFDKQIENNLMEQVEASERMNDKYYDKYFHLIHDNFEKDVLDEVKSKVGTNMFTTKHYIDVLQQVYNDQQKGTIDTYKDYTLIKSKDCFNCMTYFIYDRDGDQVEDSFDFYDNESAIKRFHSMVDAGYFVI